jgi:hypothetical protein
LSNSFKKVALAIKESVASGSIRAMNKALTKTKSKVSKDLKSATNLDSKTLKKRVNVIKAKKGKSTGSVGVAVKYGLPLSAFSPKEKKVTLPGRKASGRRGRPKVRTYYGVTVKVGNRPRELVPGGFLRTVRSGKDIVLTRVSKTRYPILEPKTDILRKAAEEIRPSANKYLKQELDNAINLEISDAFNKKIGK